MQTECIVLVLSQLVKSEEYNELFWFVLLLPFFRLDWIEWELKGGNCNRNQLGWNFISGVIKIVKYNLSEQLDIFLAVLGNTPIGAVP